MDLRKPTKLVGNSSRRFTRPSLQGAKRLGCSVRAALGNTGTPFRYNKQTEFPHDDDEDSGFFHDPDEAVRQTAMEMFWTQHVHQIKVGNSVDDEDLSSTGFSDSLSDHSSLMKSAHTTKTAAVVSKKSDLDTTTRSNVSAKTLDPSDLRGGTDKKKKKDKALKRIDFTGNIVDSDDEDDDEDTNSRKSKSSKVKKNKSKKSKKKKSTSKKKKKSKSLRISIADVSDDDAVVGSSFEGSNSGPMVAGDIIVPEAGTLISEETAKGQEDSVTDLVTIPKPKMLRRSTTAGTSASAFSADPSITHIMERIALEDEKYGDRKVQQKLEQEVEELLDENEDLHLELEEQFERNQKLQTELERMETMLQTTKLQAPKQDDMEILHEEIQRLQNELVQERRTSEQQSKESRSEIIVLQQAVDSLREEVSLASNSIRSMNNSGLNTSINSDLNASTHSDNGKSVERLQLELLTANQRIEELENFQVGQKSVEALEQELLIANKNIKEFEKFRREHKSVERLQGELLISNGKIEELEKARKEQHDEVRKLRYLLDKFKENTGVKELEEKLEGSEKETTRLRLELENVEKDWEEKLRSKEETIEYFLKELSELKLRAPGSSDGTMSRGYSRTLSKAEMKDVLRVGPEELAASPEPKRFSWLRRGERRQFQE